MIGTNGGKPRIAIYGIGQYGAHVARFAVQKGWPIVAAFNRTGPKVGQDLPGQNPRGLHALVQGRALAVDLLAVHDLAQKADRVGVLLDFLASLKVPRNHRTGFKVTQFTLHICLTLAFTAEYGRNNDERFSVNLDGTAGFEIGYFVHGNVRVARELALCKQRID